MNYHAKLSYGANKELFVSNWDEEAVINKILIPFFNGHIIEIADEKDNLRILNLKSASELRIYSTSHKLVSDKESIHVQITNKEFEANDCTKEIMSRARLLRTSSSSLSILEKMFSIENKNQVFVIMKYGDKELDSAYEGVIKTVFNEFSLEVVRVDEIQDSGKISEQILRCIAESKIIYAELSGERPNCYFETGFAMALGKEIILTNHKKKNIHFDLADNRFIRWETENELRNQLKARIKSILKNK